MSTSIWNQKILSKWQNFSWHSIRG